jgi:hypothetical protein
MTIVFSFDLLMRAFFCLGVCGVSFLTLPLGFRVLFEKPTFVTCYDPIKKIWFFRAVQAFLSTLRFDVLFDRSIFFGTIFTHIFLMFKSLCNNFVDSTFINIKFIGDHSNCQTSTLTNESPHKVDVCACSHRGGESRSPFIFHRLSPI